VAAFAAFSPFFITNENVKPVLALFAQENTRFWAGQPLTRTIDVFNDSGRDADIEVSLQLTQNGKTSTPWKQTVKLLQGRIASVQATVPALSATNLSEVKAELVTRIGGVEQSRRQQDWAVIPRSWVGSVNNVTVGVFDPRGSTKGLFESLGVKPVTITDVGNLSNQKIDVLIVGENIEAADVAAAPTAVAQWVNNGGQALVLRQKKIGDWIPVPLTPKDDVYGFETFLYAVGNPIVDGLLPEDFWRWGNAELVNGMAYEPPRAGTVRVLAGKLPADATLMEARYGSGRFIINALELTANKLAQEPAAARLLANILRDAKNSAQAAPTKPVLTTGASARVTPPATTGNKTLVLSGVAGARTEALKDKMRLEADFATQAPASLAPYNLVILTDYDAAASKTELGLKYQYFGMGRDNPLYLRNIAVKAQGDNKSILGADTASMQTFRFQNRGQETVGEKVGEGPFPWSFNMWDAKSLGEWALEKDPVTNQNAIALRNLEGETALQMYNWQKTALQPGTTYEVSFDYMTSGTGKFSTEGEGFENKEFDLAASPRQWKTFTTRIAIPAGPAPSAEFAPTLRKWVNNGGTLVVQNVTAPLQKWLESALDVRFTRNRMEAVRAHKTAHDPLLQGISDGDLAWRGHSGEWAITNRGPSEHDIIREEVIPEGARVLTWPAVLVTKPLGRGRLIVDQSRWAEVTNKGGEEWGLDSRLIAARCKPAADEPRRLLQLPRNQAEQPYRPRFRAVEHREVFQPLASDETRRRQGLD
jgi:hypothetical protein